MGKLSRKQTIFTLTLILFGVLLALPSFAQPATPIEGCTVPANRAVDIGNGPVTGVVNKTTFPSDWGTICLLNTINSITDWLFVFLIAGAVLAIVIAGFMYLTMGGNTARQGTATKLIMGAVIGIVIAMLARIIPTVVTGILT